MPLKDVVDILERSRKLTMNGLPFGLAIGKAVQEQRIKMLRSAYECADISFKKYRDRVKEYVNE